MLVCAARVVCVTGLHVCCNVLRDVSCQVARKRKEREVVYEKKQDLARPLKKRKAAPNHKFTDAPGAPPGAAAQVGGERARENEGEEREMGGDGECARTRTEGGGDSVVLLLRC